MSADPRRASLTLPRGLQIYLALVIFTAAATFAVMLSIEIGQDAPGTDWVLFGLLSATLLAAEVFSASWMRFGANGSTVSPTWGLSYALLLLGSPTAAMAAAGFTIVVTQIRKGNAPLRAAFNVSQLVLSLGLGGLVLWAFGIEGPVFAEPIFDMTSWLAIILAAAALFLANGLLVAYAVSRVERTAPLPTLTSALRLSLAADAPIMLLAPVLVVTAERSLLLLPLIGVAAFLVYRTADQAMVLGHEADHDGLTQLLNRRAFLAELNGYANDASADAAAVMILDLDRFKEINDRLGHEIGDHVLQEFARRLAESLSPDTVTARLGGDEFAVLLRSAGPDNAMAAVYELHDALSSPLIVDGFPLSMGTSIGVALAPQHGSTASALIRAADIAMYRAKQVRSGVELFEDTGVGKDRGRVALLADLTGAIENREFTLHYQPQVSMLTGAIVSIEALIRWDHPRLGRIAPGDFISLAEQTDLIEPLTDLVIRTSLEEIAPLPSGVALALNVSARNLQDARFAGKVLALLAVKDFPPERFEIELTESSIANEPERTEMAFHELRDAGVRVAVDDFGTGYSSFATLRDLDVDKIKIDRSLVAEVALRVRDRRIVSSIIDLAHALGCEVVAEGVESESGWSHLVDAGCDMAQGFAVARPMTAGQIASLLEGDAPAFGPLARRAAPKNPSTRLGPLTR